MMEKEEIEKLDKFMEEHKVTKVMGVQLIRIIPFEWNDFRKELIENGKRKS